MRRSQSLLRLGYPEFSPARGLLAGAHEVMRRPATLLARSRCDTERRIAGATFGRSSNYQPLCRIVEAGDFDDVTGCIGNPDVLRLMIEVHVNGQPSVYGNELLAVGRLLALINTVRLIDIVEV